MARSSGKGGMQTGATHPSLYCPKCGKPAARMEWDGIVTRYLHFTKKGSVWHEVKAAQAGEGEHHG